MHPCPKRNVCAVIIDKNGRIASGQNTIKVYTDKCPRSKGENYDKCKSICGQENHAETAAIKDALEKGLELSGSTLYLLGHYHACLDCQKACIEHDIKIEIVNEDCK